MKRIVMAAAFVFVATAGDVAADFKLAASDDVVILVDGTKIRGTVIAKGLKAVVVVVKGEKDGEAREIVIPKTKVERIEKGESDREISSFTTDGVDGIKVVTGEGFRDTESEEPPAPAADPGSNENKASGGKKGELRKRLEKAMGSNPVVRQMIVRGGGLDNVMQRLETDDGLRRQVEGYLRLRTGGQAGQGGQGGQGSQSRRGGSGRQRERADR